MAIIGAHMSVAGGYYKAVDAAAELEMDCVQIFTNSPSQWVVSPAKSAKKAVKANQSAVESVSLDEMQWQARAVTSEECGAFQDRMRATKLIRPLAHASYLINLAAPSDELWSRSIAALIVERRRAELLGLDAVVFHPGSFTTSSPSEGLTKIVKGLEAVYSQTAELKCKILLENTAGQGSNLGADLSDLGFIVRELGAPAWLAVCLDTCHAMAAGFDLSSKTGLKQLLESLESEVGLEKVAAIHLNDSKKECGSRVDRHEHIGKGTIGLEGFKAFLKTKALKHLPMYLETPKGTDEESGEEFDAINLRVVRSLCKS